MLIVTSDTVSDRQITKVLGLVQGSTVRAKNVGADILAGLKNLIGGELGGYTEMLEESRQEALQRMVADARSKGADAVVACRISTSSVAAGAAEMLCYGTAVKLAPPAK